MEQLKRPEKIYLQWDPEASDFGQLTWCTDKINDTDIEFFAGDVVKVCEEQAERQGFMRGFQSAGLSILTELQKLR